MFSDRGPFRDDDQVDAGVRGTGDGDVVLDPDADDEVIDSAEADRIAAGAYDDDDDDDDDEDEDFKV